MAKRLINKSRIKRLSTFPWIDGVEEKDLPKANLEELTQALHDHKNKSTDDDVVVIQQQDKLLERLIAAQSEPIPEPSLTIYEPPADDNRLTIHVYMAEPGWVDVTFPGLARDEQAAAIELANEDVLACIWVDYDGYFMIDCTSIKRFPFQTMFMSADEEENKKYLALFDDDQNQCSQ